MERATIAKRHTSVAIIAEKIFPVSSFRATDLAESGGGGRLANCESCISTAILEDTRLKALGLRQPRALHGSLPALYATLYHFTILSYRRPG